MYTWLKNKIHESRTCKKQVPNQEHSLLTFKCNSCNHWEKIIQGRTCCWPVAVSVAVLSPVSLWLLLCGRDKKKLFCWTQTCNTVLIVKTAPRLNTIEIHHRNHVSLKIQGIEKKSFGTFGLKAGEHPCQVLMRKRIVSTAFSDLLASFLSQCPEEGTSRYAQTVFLTIQLGNVDIKGCVRNYAPQLSSDSHLIIYSEEWGGGNTVIMCWWGSNHSLRRVKWWKLT